MKFSETAKFQPGMFVPQTEEDIQHQVKAIPFKELNNTLNTSKASHKKQRRNRGPKKFLEQQEQTDLQTQNEQSYKIAKQITGQIYPHQKDNQEETTSTQKRQNKVLYDFNLDSDSESNQEVPQVNDTQVECPQTQREEIAANFNRLHLLDWTMSSDLGEEEQTPPSLTETENKKDPQIVPVSTFPAPDLINKSVTGDILFERLPPNTTARCIVRRDKKNHEGVTEYNVYFQQSLKHILTVKKEGMWQYGLYIRFCKGTSFSYQKVASIQSNFLSNKFTLLRKECKDSELTVCYQTNLLGLKGPRKLHIYIPKGPLPFEYLNQAYEHKNFRDKVQKCVSKSAKWNQKVKSYTLSFKGRALQSSIKNFVISDENEDDDKFFIIFGKAGPDIYNLDIESPFSLIQAVSVAITSFERKLTCD